MKKLIPLLWTIGISTFSFTQNNRIYVNVAASGDNTGLSWLNAFTDLQTAIEYAQHGDEIWIAHGTYKPTQSSDRSISFEPKSGTRLFGGFAGHEVQLGQRDLQAYPTILSGNIGSASDSTDNTYNVVYLYEPDSNTIIDGLVIQSGTANNTDVSTSIRDRPVCGGGLYVDAGDSGAFALIQNCNFEHNAAYHYGGGAMINGGTGGAAGVTFSSCTFVSNSVVRNGGGVARFGGAGIKSGLFLANCGFSNNQAKQRGGGLFLSSTDGTDSLKITSCTFNKNQAAFGGAGLFFFWGRPEKSYLSFRGIHFDDNLTSQGSGAAINLQSNGNVIDGVIEIDSCLFKRNINNTNGNNSNIINIDQLGVQTSELTIRSSEFIENSADGDIISASLGEAPVSLHAVKFFKNQGLGHVLNLSYFSECRFSNVEFTGNQQKYLTLFGLVPSASVRNCHFSQNNINDSYAFSVNPDMNKLAFTNCTFGNAFATHLLDGSIDTLVIDNCAFASKVNLFESFSNVFPLRGHIANAYLNSFICPTQYPLFTCGPGILTGIDPLFIDSGSGDYRLQSCSPLINAGNNNAAAGPGVDLAGHPRIAQGTVDIGAYESAGPHLAVQPGVSPSCPGGSSGAVLPNVLDACPPLSYTWQSGLATGTTLERLPVGVYTVTATDAKGQTTTFSASVPEGAAPALIPASMPVICGDTLGGMALATLQNGKTPFSYHWSGGSTDSLRTGLAAGAYPVTVTDANGCTAAGAVEVEATGNLSVDIELGAISCHGAADGSFTVLPADGKAPFTWHWENGANTPTLAPLGPGAYLGTLTDALGCNIGWILPMGEPGLLALHPQITPASDSALADGRIELMPTGGTGPFQALWNTGATGLSVDSLAAGFYSVTLTDAHDCTAAETIPVGVGTATGEAPGAGSAFSLFPNPATALVTVTLEQPAARERRLQLRTIAGQLLYETTVLPGHQSINFQVNNWARGMYVVQLDGRAQKLVLQ